MQNYIAEFVGTYILCITIHVAVLAFITIRIIF